MRIVRPREDQAQFKPWLDEDGARALAGGKVPAYVRKQCRDFLRFVDEGIKAGMRQMRINARAQRRRERANERTRQG